MALVHMVDQAELRLPERSREAYEHPTPVHSQWLATTTVDGVRSWKTTLPVRPRTLFFHRAPDDMAVLRRKADRPLSKGTPLKLADGLAKAGRANSWAFTSASLTVRRAVEEGPPSPGEYGVRYGRALEREQGLNLAESGLEPTEFVARSAQLGDTSRMGLLLPAPASATWTLDIPEGAVLDLHPLILPSELAPPDDQSDGATLWVEQMVDGQATTLGRFSLEPGPGRQERVSLAGATGANTTLRLRTEGGQTDLLDYVFVADPVVHVPQAQPPRVVVVFIDTLRPDAMSLYGAERATTPKLDAWAQDAAVFTEARSVAPWTLPSARTLVTGSVPERWGTVASLQKTLAAQGWATGFVAGNVYLSSNFGMAEDWTVHRCINWPQGAVQVDRATELLEQWSDRPSFLLVHTMDMHLPYTEPPTHRDLFAGERPEGFKSDYFLRKDVLKAAKDKASRAWVRDRYDNNLRYLDDKLAPLLAALGPNDLVVLMSDHGEEFWDHGDFEHGHSLYEELLRVPLVIKGPGVAAGRLDTPVSLLDVAPTIAHHLGLDTSSMDGRPLQALADGSAHQAFEDRPLAFGRPLYGRRRWGVLSGDRKYTSTEGRERVVDLSTDPDEKRPSKVVPDRSELLGAMGLALERETRVGFRLLPSAPPKAGDLHATLTVPGGIDAAYVASDPLKSCKTEVQHRGEQAEIVWKSGARTACEVFVLPTVPAGQAATGLVLGVGKGGDLTEARRPVASDTGPAAEGTPADPPQADWDGTQTVLLNARHKHTKVRLTFAVVPRPLADARALIAVDPEVAEELAALGYLPEAEEEAQGPDPAEPER